MDILKHNGIGLITIKENGYADVKVVARNNPAEYVVDKGLQKLYILKNLVLNKRWTIFES